jgi:amino acid adenylation domain-containing protein
MEMIVGLLAVLKAGGAVVPFDPAYPAGRLRFMLEDCGLRLLLTQADLQHTFQQDGVTALSLDTLEIGGEEDEDGEADLALELDPHQLAYVIYTSGSSGVPKGVLVEHRGLLNVARVQQDKFGLGESSRVLQFSSLSFDAAVFEIMMAFFSGGTLYLGRQESLYPGLPLLRFLQDNAITIVTLPPSALAALPLQELPALTTITVAGEACPAGIVDKWAPGRQFFNLYGPTEATIWTTYAACEANGGKPAIGRPIANAQVYVMDRDGNLLPRGVPGELVIGGVGVARGYLNRDALTAERFIADPFASHAHARLYRSGDLVRYRPDGQLDFLGRLDHQVKLRGYRIEIGEIETVLVQHPLVHDAAVMQRDVAGDPSLSAYVVTTEQASLAPIDLQAYLQQRLPGFMVPAEYVFLGALPLLPNGKVDRKALSVLESTPQATAFEPPQTEYERLIAEIWQNCLKVDRVGLYDNFFDLGGHSLLLATVHLRLVEALKIDVPLVVLFQYPTVKLLAEHFASVLKPPPQKVQEASPMLNTQARAERQREMLRSLRSADKAYKGRL